jgi:hypothetical protein
MIIPRGKLDLLFANRTADGSRVTGPASTMLSFAQRLRESRHDIGNAILAGLAVCSQRTATREQSAGGQRANEPISGTGNFSFRHQDAPRRGGGAHSDR